MEGLVITRHETITASAVERTLIALPSVLSFSVRHLVELHGGTVRADSAGEGRGATFTVELPMLSAGDRV